MYSLLWNVDNYYKEYNFISMYAYVTCVQLRQPFLTLVCYYSLLIDNI